MAWWWKRNASNASTNDTRTEDVSELDSKRPAQPAPIPAPRGATEGYGVQDIADPQDRWDIIKRDLVELDPDFFNDLDALAEDELRQSQVHDLTDERLAESMRRLSIRFLIDEGGALLAMWERHVVQIRREGPSGEILVLRARAYATLPTEWDDRAYRAVNEWNRSRRFLKAYIGEPTESGRLPLYGETQIPLRPGITDDLLDEFIDCAAAVSGAYIDWLHGDGGVL